MIAAAIVCAAVVGNASNFMWGNDSYSIDNWTGNAAVDPDLEAPMYKGGAMYLYLGTVGYTDGVGFDIGTATLVISGSYNADEYMYGTGGAAGYAQSDAVNKMGGEAYTLILTEDGKALADMANGDHFVLRTGTSTTTYDADLSDNVAMFTNSNAIGAGDWTAYNAPEPTSGLLLLLGVAGLALKRKRA